MYRHLEAVFDQPDLVEPDNLDEVEVAVNYRATATRTGKQWTAIARDLPGGHIVQAQCATWREVKQNIAQCVFELHGDAPGVAALYLAPADPEAAAALNAVVAARQARVLAEQAERDAVRNAARLLISQGWSTRDAGSALMLSHQRISQIAPRPTA